MIDRKARILVTGAGGMVGHALTSELAAAGFGDVLTPSSAEVDMRDGAATIKYLKDAKPEYVYHLAAKVYGMKGNRDNKGLSFYENVLINTNVVEACREVGVKKIVAMGSGAVYPYPPPDTYLKEETMWNGFPHESEDSYAISKRALSAQLEAYNAQYGTEFVFAISGNLYGPHDKFDTDGGHVTPSLVAKFHHAKTTGGRVQVWGSGQAQRDFTFGADIARALIICMDKGQGSINVGSGFVHKIADVVDILTDITGLHGRVDYTGANGDGQMFRAYDLARLQSLGFQAQAPLRVGLEQTYAWYEANHATARR